VVWLSPLATEATTGLLYQPQMIDDGDCGATGGMKIGMGNRSTRRKPAPAPLCPPQIPLDQIKACIQTNRQTNGENFKILCSIKLRRQQHFTSYVYTGHDAFNTRLPVTFGGTHLTFSCMDANRRGLKIAYGIITPWCCSPAIFEPNDGFWRYF
jgi:hypothetical protein